MESRQKRVHDLCAGETGRRANGMTGWMSKAVMDSEKSQAFWRGGWRFKCCREAREGRADRRVWVRMGKGFPRNRFRAAGWCGGQRSLLGLCSVTWGPGRGATPGSHTQTVPVPLAPSGWRPDLLLSIMRRPEPPPNNEGLSGSKCQ